MSVPTNTEVLQAIREELDAIKVPDALEASEDQTWQDLDVDSLDLVELAQIVEDEYAVVLKGEDMKELKTVGDAVDLITARAA